ncbi:MAG: SurA N-terminal domain-containing protein, partial [Gammaproteobacteria bacterium]
MLGQIRDRATGWIAGVIVGALIISFAFWGVSFYFGGDGQANVATVNDTNIDLQTYQRAFSNLRRQMQQIFGDEISLEEEELIRQQTLQRLVDTEIINQIVRENNFQITDQQVAATITNLELFQDEEGFDRNKYEQGIASLGMAPAYFEQQLRMDLLSEQLQAGLTETLFVTKEELNDVLRMKNQVRDITYAIISIEDYKDEIEVSENDIQAYYDENKQRYASPEMVRIAYIDMDVEKIAENVEFTEQDLRDYYQS